MRWFRSRPGGSGYAPEPGVPLLEARTAIPSRLRHEERRALLREGHALVEELSDADLEVVVRLLRRLAGGTGP